MAVYVIGDLHLSQSVKKSMEIFLGWENYTQRIEQQWLATVSEQDTVVLAGDISWGTTMAEAMADFLLIDRLPGKKLVLKGNHDYWWGSLTSMRNALAEAGAFSIDFLHNNHYIADGLALCGSRGWLFENNQPHDMKIVKREVLRIEASLNSVGDETLEKVLFLHYPPIFSEQVLKPFIDCMERFQVKRCYYGHIHANGHRFVVQGEEYGINFKLVSADYLEFTPLLVENLEHA